MKHARLAIGMAIIGATAASLIGLVPASAAVRSSTLPAAHVPAHALVHAAALPRGLRPALRPAVGKPRSGRIRPLDSIACYDGDSILSAANGRWVSAELGYTGGNYAMLRARASAVGPWEQFAICYDYTYGYWFFLSDRNGLAVSAELGYTGGNYAMLRARASAVGPWERYSLYCTSSGTLVINSNANGRWVSAELGYTGGNYAMLRARATAIGPWEQYYTLTGRVGC